MICNGVDEVGREFGRKGGGIGRLLGDSFLSLRGPPRGRKKRQSQTGVT